MIWRSCIYLMRHNTTFVYFSFTRLCCDTAEVINSTEFPLPATVCKTKNHNCLLANKGWPSMAGQVDRFRVEGIVPAFIVYCVSTRVKGNISVYLSLTHACTACACRRVSPITHRSVDRVCCHTTSDTFRLKRRDLELQIV